MARPSNPGSFSTRGRHLSALYTDEAEMDHSLSLRSGLEWCIHTRLPPNKAVSQALSPPEKGAHSHSRCGVQRRSSTLSGVSSTVKNLLEVPPDLPSNCSSLRDLNCTHSNYKTQKSPVSVFIVTTSPCRDWVICAPAAFLGCSSRFSGSFSGVEP